MVEKNFIKTSELTLPNAIMTQILTGDAKETFHRVFLYRLPCKFFSFFFENFPSNEASAIRHFDLHDEEEPMYRILHVRPLAKRLRQHLEFNSKTFVSFELRNFVPAKTICRSFSFESTFRVSRISATLVNLWLVRIASGEMSLIAKGISTFSSRTLALRVVLLRWCRYHDGCFGCDTCWWPPQPIKQGSSSREDILMAFTWIRVDSAV